MKKTNRILALVLVLTLAFTALLTLAACQSECDKNGHKYVDGKCTVCGAVDPDYEGHVHAYGVDGYCSCGEVDPSAVYTRNLSMSLSPATWNPFTYKTSNDSVVLDYTTDGFYAFDYKDLSDPAAGYDIVPSMAAEDPIDVTADYVGRYDVKEGETGKAFRITLKDDLKFEDGTAITAETYVETFRRLLDPEMANSRASNYYTSNPAIVGAEAYAKGTGKSGWYSAVEVVGETADSFEGLYFDATNVAAFDSIFEEADMTVMESIKSYFQVGEVNVWDELVKYAGENRTPMTKEISDMLASLFGEQGALGNFWNWADNEIPYFSVAEKTFAVQDFDTTVGVIAHSATELDIIYNSEIVGFYIKYSLGLPLVNIAKYDASITTDATTGLKSSNYATSVETYVGCSYGPYKLVTFVDGQQLVFERNDNYFAYSERYADEYGTIEIDGKTFRQYQTDRVVITQVSNTDTGEMKFLAGELDSMGMNAARLKEYGGNPDLIYTEGYSTFFGIINSDYDSLRAREIVMNNNDKNSKKYNNTILSIKEFRQALSYGIDREELCRLLYPAGSAAFGMFSEGIIADPVNSKTFRSFDEAKEALCRTWGIEYGADKTFKTLDEAVKSIKGYDLAKARELVDVAVDKAIELGYMDSNSIVKIYHNEADDSDTASLWHRTFKAWFEELMKGTKLEGKFLYELDTSLGNNFGEAIRSGKADCAWGFGFTGSALDPWGLCEVYLDSAYGGSYQYDPYNNYAKIYPDVKIAVDFGEGEKDYTYNLVDWWAITQGMNSPISGKALPNGSYQKIADNYRAKILAKIEECLLLQYTCIPIMNEGSVQLNSYKIRFYDTDTYVYGVGYGGIRYTTYYYTDAEWAAYVASQGGTLNYK